MKIWLDDTRDPNSPVEGVIAQAYMKDRSPSDAEGWTWIRTAGEAIALLSTVQVEEISLDHDLGDNPVFGNGNQVLVWLEEAVFTNADYWPPLMHVHSGNQSAREKMDLGLQALLRRLDARGEAPPPGPRRPPAILPTGQVFGSGKER